MSEEYPLMAFIANEGVAPKGERFPKNIHYEVCTGRSIVRRLCKYCKVIVSIKMNILNRWYDQKWNFRLLAAIPNILSFHILGIVILREWHIWIIQQLDCVLNWLIPDWLFFEIFQSVQQIVITFAMRISKVNNTGYPPVSNCKKQVVSDTFASQMP